MEAIETGLRSLARRAVQQRITEVAEELFVANGYANTTIDDVAAAVGTSRRSVFRYFASKEEIVVGKFDFVGDELIDALLARPVQEPVWESLRRMFDVLVPFVDAPGKHEVAEPMQRIVFATPTLLASYLQKLERLKDLAEAAVRGRADRRGDTFAVTDPRPRAVVAAAFGCLLAAQQVWLAGGATEMFSSSVDRAMAAMQPTFVQ